MRLLLEENDSIANVLAATLEEENRTRQQVDRQTLAEAMEMLEGSFLPERDYVVVLGGKNWHSGVIGLVASRVVERLHRPTILFALSEGATLARGSARSIPGFNLYEALKECSGYLERFGGHKYAAGMDIKPENIDAFRAAFQKVAEQKLSPEDLIPEVNFDLELPLSAVNEGLLRLLRHFGPFGVGNPTPIFVSRNVRVNGQPREVGEGHVKFELLQDGAKLTAIGFGMAERARELDVGTHPIDVAYQLQENHWNGRIELQARLLDMRRPS